MTTPPLFEGLGLSPAACSALSALSVQQLRSLMISDFDRLGVTEMGDKQRLFRALRQLSEPSPQLTPQPSGGIGRCARGLGCLAGWDQCRRANRRGAASIAAAAAHTLQAG